MRSVIVDQMQGAAGYSLEKATQRVRDHLQCIDEYAKRKGKPGHSNGPYGFPVVTSQETDLELITAQKVEQHAENEFCVHCGRFDGARTVLNR